jgi:hypothetical protein
MCFQTQSSEKGFGIFLNWMMSFLNIKGREEDKMDLTCEE